MSSLLRELSVLRSMFCAGKSDILYVSRKGSFLLEVSHQSQRSSGNARPFRTWGVGNARDIFHEVCSGENVNQAPP